MLRVLIAAEVRFYSDGLALLLDRDERFAVVGTARTAGDLHAQVRRLEPDIVLLDLDLPGAVPLLRMLAAETPGVGVIALAIQERDDAIIECAEAGASGFVTRESSLDELMITIESAARGELRCSARISATLMRRVGTLAAQNVAAPTATTTTLTGRELDVLELIERGLSNKEIARELSIEVATVKNHVHNILEKLRVHRRSEAGAALRSGVTI